MHDCSVEELASARELVGEASDADLLDGMAARDAQPALAVAALEEFIRRHRLFVFKVCRNLIDRYGTASGWNDEEFATAIFQKVYRSAHTYRNVDNITDVARLRRLKAWIGRIANNLLIDKWRRCRSVLFDDAFLQCLESAEPTADFPTEIHRLIFEAIQKMPDKERIVMIRTLRYMEARKHQRLPNDVCRELRDRLQTTSSNIRKIRKRANALIETHLAENGYEPTVLFAARTP